MMKFTTKDKDNDVHSALNCALRHSGAWWFKNCYTTHLNGAYSRSSTVPRGAGVIWDNFKGHTYSLKFTEMKFQRHD